MYERYGCCLEWIARLWCSGEDVAKTILGVPTSLPSFVFTCTDLTLSIPWS